MQYEEIIDVCEKMIALRRAGVRQALMKTGMHLGQPEMLSYVAAHPGCTQRQIADSAGVTPASIAASFKRMEHAGLIYRKSDDVDLRCNHVFITEKGKSLLTCCSKAVDQVNQAMLDGLSAEQLELLLCCLEQINLNLSGKIKKDA